MDIIDYEFRRIHRKHFEIVCTLCIDFVIVLNLAVSKLQPSSFNNNYYPNGLKLSQRKTKKKLII
nr:hypothetical protein [Bacteroidaceae bacterium]